MRRESTDFLFVLRQATFSRYTDVVLQLPRLTTPTRNRRNFMSSEENTTPEHGSGTQPLERSGPTSLGAFDTRTG